MSAHIFFVSTWCSQKWFCERSQKKCERHTKICERHKKSHSPFPKMMCHQPNHQTTMTMSHRTMTLAGAAAPTNQSTTKPASQLPQQHVTHAYQFNQRRPLPEGVAIIAPFPFFNRYANVCHSNASVTTEESISTNTNCLCIV